MMTPSELAEEVSETVALAQSRIKGIGKDQYHDAETGRQRFETMDLDGLFVYAEEELLDQINYAVMLRIRLRRLRAMVAASRLPEMVAIDRDRAERLLAVVRCEFAPINDEPHRLAFWRARKAIRDGDLADLPKGMGS